MSRHRWLTMRHIGISALCTFLLAAFAVSNALAGSEFSGMWYSKKSSIVLDAYEYTPIDWQKLKKNERLMGFINKASDGLPPTASCRGSDKYCRLAWRRYSIAKELYHTRKGLAKSMGLKWGAYHLARPGNPIRQALHFLSFARPEKDDLIALDIEDNDSKKWMSLKDAERFAKVIHRRLGRYPMLYTNHSTARFVAQNRKKYPILAKMNLWYARYKSDIRGAFPMGNWDSYTMWQFSAQANCTRRRCLRRIQGADRRIDVNVIAMAPDAARKAWPFSELTAREPEQEVVPELVVASAESNLTTMPSAVEPKKPGPDTVPGPELASVPHVPLATTVAGASLSTTLLNEAAGVTGDVGGLLTRSTPLPSSVTRVLPATLPRWRPGTMITVTTIRRAIPIGQSGY